MKTKQFFVPFEIKAIGDDGTFTAYLSVFDIVDEGMDRITFGAFKNTLAEKGDTPFPLLYQHDTHEVIGGFRATEDSIGLKMDPAFFNLDTQRGKEAYSNAKKGLLTGFSVGYSTIKSQRDETTGIRTITELKLWEGSIVTFPMNPKAQLLTVKDDKDLPRTAREFEAFLRDAGWSRSEAKRLVSHGFKGAKDEDAEDEERDASNDEAIQKLKALNKSLRSMKHART